MSDDALRFRVTRSDGRVLANDTLRPGDRVEAAADAAAEHALAAEAAGYGWVLEACDPDGDIFPAGRWVTLDERRGPSRRAR